MSMFMHIFLCWRPDFWSDDDAWDEEEDYDVLLVFAFLVKGTPDHMLHVKFAFTAQERVLFSSVFSSTHHTRRWNGDIYLSRRIHDAGTMWCLPQTAAHFYLSLMYQL